MIHFKYLRLPFHSVLVFIGNVAIRNRGGYGSEPITIHFQLYTVCNFLRLCHIYFQSIWTAVPQKNLDIHHRRHVLCMMFMLIYSINFYELRASTCVNVNKCMQLSAIPNSSRNTYIYICIYIYVYIYMFWASKRLVVHIFTCGGIHGTEVTILRIQMKYTKSVILFYVC